MIESQYAGNLTKSAGMGVGLNCRPDPEERLQWCRKQIVECDEAEAMLFKLMDAPIHINFGGGNDNAFNCAVGSIAGYRYRLRKEEAEWLAEIDKG